MNTDSTAITLRPLAPTDGPAIAELFEQTPDAGQIRFTEIARKAQELLALGYKGFTRFSGFRSTAGMRTDLLFYVSISYT